MSRTSKTCDRRVTRTITITTSPFAGGQSAPVEVVDHFVSLGSTASHAILPSLQATMTLGEDEGAGLPAHGGAVLGHTRGARA
jgi:hypothetical protein